MLRCFALLAMLLGGACAQRSADFPWDLPQLRRDLSDAVRFEGITRPIHTVEPLGWRIDEGPPGEPQLPRAPSGLRQPLPKLPRPRREVALVWAHLDDSTWLLVQLFRHDGDERWQRSLSYREPVAPLKQLQPGEDAEGTWHAMQRFTRPPTGREICAFATVSFLAPSAPPWRTVSAEWDRRAWESVAGEAPPCPFASGGRD